MESVPLTGIVHVTGSGADNLAVVRPSTGLHGRTSGNTNDGDLGVDGGGGVVQHVLAIVVADVRGPELTFSGGIDVRTVGEDLTHGCPWSKKSLSALHLGAMYSAEVIPSQGGSSEDLNTTTSREYIIFL